MPPSHRDRGRHRPALRETVDPDHRAASSGAASDRLNGLPAPGCGAGQALVYPDEGGSWVDDTLRVTEEQAALWNGSSGDAWIAAQAVLDDLFRPVEALLADTASSLAATNVLDVGCGTG